MSEAIEAAIAAFDKIWDDYENAPEFALEVIERQAIAASPAAATRLGRVIT